MLEPQLPEEPDAVLGSASPIRQGVAWNTIGQVAGRIVVFVFGFALARLLSPAEFGFYGLAMAVLTLGLTFSDLGVGSALIQRQDDIRENASAAFYLNLLAVVFVTALVLVAARPVAEAYNQPILEGLLIVMGIAFLFRGSAAVHDAFLRKRMRFRRVQVITVGGLLVNGLIATALAAAGVGPWALALGLLAGNIFYGVLIIILAGMPLSLNPYLSRWKGLMGFGLTLLASTAVWSLVSQIPNLIVGGSLGPTALGFYVIAFSYGGLPQIIIGSAIAQVLFVALSEAHHDHARLLALTMKAERTLAFVCFPATIALVFLGPQVLTLALGERWAPAATAFQILACQFTFMMFVSPFPVIYLAMNRPVINLMFAAATLPAIVIAVLIGLRWGVTGVAAGVALVMAIHALIHVPVAARLLDVRARLLFGQVAPQAAITAVATCLGLPAFLVWRGWAGAPWVACAVSLAAYVVLARWRTRPIWQEGVEESRALVRSVLPGSSAAPDNAEA